MDLENFYKSFRILELNFGNLKLDKNGDYLNFMFEELKEEGICNGRFLKAIKGIINHEEKLYGLPSKGLIKKYLPDQELLKYREIPYLLQNNQYEGSVIPNYKKEMFNCFRRFASTAAGQYAKENNFLGYFYENGNYTGGLINYVANILLFQVNVLTKRDGFNFSYPKSTIDGFTSEDETNFTKWLNSEKNIDDIIQGNKLDESLNRRNDMVIVAKYYKKTYSS
jgi:hypothetical protein